MHGNFPYFRNERSRTVVRKEILKIQNRIKRLNKKVHELPETERNKIRDKIFQLEERLRDLEDFYRRLPILEDIYKRSRGFPRYGTDQRWSKLQ
jgi:predicted RNase H-like nuclease (RuvC/YqgF family)